MAEAHIIGSILGAAVGDAIGLPYEGLSRARASRLLGPPDRHRFCFGHGMISDDTELTCMVAQALIGSGGNVESFRRQFAWRLRLWLLTLPAGIGLATLRAILRLWIGFGPERSGVFSAGNGPAIRSAIIGAAVDDGTLLSELVRASSRITHTDPKAEGGALAVALAAQMARQDGTVSGDGFVSRLRSLLGRAGDELVSLVQEAVDAAGRGESTESFAESLGLAKGVSGYVHHTVPVALHAWLAHQRDYRSAVSAVIRCGGDADSTAAIVGGIVGASVGKDGIPAEWLGRVKEWPRSAAWMESLGAQLDTSLRNLTRMHPMRLPLLAVLFRNLVFLCIVLLHGFRRLLPPY
jgi:ADP-ribosylglycohydrolase